MQRRDFLTGAAACALAAPVAVAAVAKPAASFVGGLDLASGPDMAAIFKCRVAPWASFSVGDLVRLDTPMTGERIVRVIESVMRSDGNVDLKLCEDRADVYE